MSDIDRISQQLSAVSDPKALLAGLFSFAPVGFAVIGREGKIILSNREFLNLFGTEAPPDYRITTDNIAQRSGILGMIQRSFQGETVHTPTFWYDPRELTNVKITGGKRVAISLTTFPLHSANKEIQSVIAVFKDHTAEIRERESAESERDRFRAVFDSSMNGIAILDEAGRFIDVNPAAGIILGAPPDQLLRLHHASFSIDKDNLQSSWRRYQSLGQLQWEDRIQRPDGSIRYVEYETSRFATNYTLMIFRDITERKQAEQELLEKQAHLTVSQSIARVGSWEQDLDNIEDIDANTLRWSDECCRIFGYEPIQTEYTPKYFWDRVHPADRQIVDDAMQEALKQSGTFNVEHRIILPDGEQRIVHGRADILREPGTGRMLKLIGTTQDITERKQTETLLQKLNDQLRISEANYREIFEKAADAIFVHDLKSGGILDVNHQACELTGYTPEELFQLSIGDFSAKEQGYDQDKAMQAIREAAAGKPQTFEWIFRRKDNTTRWVEVNVIRAQIAEENRILGFVRDIEERKKLAVQLLQAQRLEAIGRLAGGVAHDFNNLLTIINGYSELLLTDTTPDDPNRELLQGIHEAGKMAAALTKQLLAFGRRSILTPSPMQLNTLIAQLRNLLRRLIGEDVELETILDPALYQVMLDPAQGEQIVMNLALNARDAMPTGGSIIIETRNIRLDEMYAEQHPEVQAGDYVVLSVSDNGVGISKETRDHIFEPFFTTKEIGKGAGMGLATVYGIVKQAEGQILIYSEEGHGTTFKIYLPAIVVAPEVESAELAPAMPMGDETILLVEDEEKVRKYVRLVLETCGYQLLVAQDGPSALRMVRRHADGIQLLLTDVIMPQMNGHQLAEALRKSYPELKVLYMSGYTDDAVVRYGILTSQIPFLQKPFTPSSLAGKVRETLDNPVSSEIESAALE
ncbi:PAS domain S-box protein [Candidatus Sumerlaeota bacterium]|nr:PAS domain S-box protein [Candidatus Sumerlaeota bacterium]